MTRRAHIRIWSATIALMVPLSLAPASTPRAEAIGRRGRKIYWSKGANLSGRGGAIGRADANGTRVRPNFITGIDPESIAVTELEQVAGPARRILLIRHSAQHQVS
jgi:hypothetical protein